MINIELPCEWQTIDVSGIYLLPENISGVYFLYNDDELLYVGKSINLKSRLISHAEGLGSSAFFSIYINKIKYFKADYYEQDIYETYAIKKLEPIFNKDKTNPCKEFQSLLWSRRVEILKKARIIINDIKSEGKRKIRFQAHPKSPIEYVNFNFERGA